MTTDQQPNLQPTQKVARYKTTRPIFAPTLNRKTTETRINDSLSLQLRPFSPTDLPHVHRLRTQPSVMINTSTGIIDADLSVSSVWMARYLPPNDATTFDLMIWVKQSDASEHTDAGPPWEHIGVLGCHMLSPVPHIGYMLRTEWWGKGIATHALKTFLRLWWLLPRREVEIDPSSMEDEHELHLTRLEWNQRQSGNAKSLDSSVTPETDVVPEILLAEIEERNFGSIKVVERCGFTYRASESVVEKNRQVTLLNYTASRPAAD